MVRDKEKKVISLSTHEGLLIQDMKLSVDEIINTVNWVNGRKNKVVSYRGFEDRTGWKNPDIHLPLKSHCCWGWGSGAEGWRTLTVGECSSSQPISWITSMSAMLAIASSSQMSWALPEWGLIREQHCAASLWSVSCYEEVIQNYRFYGDMKHVVSSSTSFIKAEWYKLYL